MFEIQVGVGPLGIALGAEVETEEVEGGMHPEQIKAELRMRGVTPAALADEMGLAQTTLSGVINGRTTSARVQARIAAVIGRPGSEIWPAKKPSLKRVLRASGAAA